MNAPLGTLAHALRWAQGQGVSRLDAQLLLLHALQQQELQRAWLIANDDAPLAPPAEASYRALIAQRLANWPVAYLLGRKEFYGVELRVGPGVLVPRAETELLVEWGGACAGEHAEDSRPLQVLDLGTGSGAIAVALARELPPGSAVWAVEASDAAAAYARENFARWAPRVRLCMGNWFDALPADAPTFDLVVSNPPYVTEGDPHLAALAQEPKGALTAGSDGLDDIRCLVRAAPQHLQPGAWLLLEHGHDQGPAVRALLSDAGFGDVQTRQDLAGLDRCSGGRWPDGAAIALYSAGAEA